MAAKGGTRSWDSKKKKPVSERVETTEEPASGRRALARSAADTGRPCRPDGGRSAGTRHDTGEPRHRTAREEPDTDDQTPCESSRGTHLEQANSWSQREGERSPGLAGGAGQREAGSDFLGAAFVRGDGEVSETVPVAAERCRRARWR